jgi:hypothetical protein
MPDGTGGLLFQVIDSGPGLRGRSYQSLFDPAKDAGTVQGCSHSTVVCARLLFTVVLYRSRAPMLPVQIGAPCRLLQTFQALGW